MLERRTPIIPYLDGWRGLAIVTVLIAHFYTYRLGWIGNFGVQLFFVLSGYLMGELLFIKKVRFSEFFVRRFSRILPTFFLFVGAMAAYALFGPGRQYSVPLNELLSTLVFSRTYFPSDISITSGAWSIGHVWSLNVEEHSYMILALGAFLARLFGRESVALLLLWLLVIVVASFSVLYSWHPPSGATEWHRRSEAAALGLVASAAYRVTSSHQSFCWLRTTLWPAALLSMLAAVACFIFYQLQREPELPLLRYTFAPLFLAFSVNQLAHAPKIMHWFLSLRLLRWFGTCSFSLYLWQQPFHDAYLQQQLSAPLALLCALAFGAISFYCWENPLRLHLNNRWAAYTRRRMETSSQASLTST